MRLDFASKFYPLSLFANLPDGVVAAIRPVNAGGVDSDGVGNILTGGESDGSTSCQRNLHHRAIPQQVALPSARSPQV